MQFTYQKIRKYPFSTLCIAAIWILSLINMPETELSDIEFADKWVHFLMYGGTCCIIWTEYLMRHSTPAAPGRILSGRAYGAFSPRKLLVWAWCMPIAMSGLLELLQEYCTASRSGDWLDLAANAVGVSMAAAVMGPLAVYLRKKKAGNRNRKEPADC